MKYSNQAKMLVGCMLITIGYALYRLISAILYSNWSSSAEIAGVLALVVLALMGGYGGYRMLTKKAFPFTLVAIFWAAQSLYIESSLLIWNLGETPRVAFGANPEETVLTIRLIPLVIYFVVMSLWFNKHRSAAATPA